MVMKITRVLAVALILLTMCSLELSGGQAIPIQPIGQDGQIPGVPMPRNGHSGDDPFPGLPNRAEQQAKAQNDDRQKRLVADTDKLLALATDLKQEVDKTNKQILSVDVIKKADEIEKLAHSVKERMKG
jgi:hypothetical protein